jgi:hypothetical protein
VLVRLSRAPREQQRAVDALIGLDIFPILRGKTASKRQREKQHARVKKLLFPLETRFFSSSIRSASGNAGSRW